MFIFETERDREWMGEGQTERETQNPKQAPGSELSAQSKGLKPRNREIMTWAKVGHLTDWATQAPLNAISKACFKIRFYLCEYQTSSVLDIHSTVFPKTM